MATIHRSRGAAAHHRRGAVIVKIAVALPVIGGFAAVGIDLSYLSSVKADLQRAADAAALAVAMQLGQTSSGDPQQDALMAAQEVVNLNPIGSGSVIVESQDILLGRAAYDADTGRYAWARAGLPPYSAAQVTLRRTNDSPSGPVPLYFGRIVGISHSELSATARAAVIPRDIALVCDLSGSMNDDSELGYYQRDEINLRDVWTALGSPTYGFMTNWGVDPIPTTYNPAIDTAGLMLMTHNTTFSSVVDPNLIAQGYTLAERNALKKVLIFPNPDVPLPGGPTYSSPNWINRVAAVLGLAQWHSGKSGGAFPGSGQGPGTPNGDNRVEDHEMVWVVPYPFAVGSWQDWIGEYMAKGPPPGPTTAMVMANSNFRYRFGLKTFVNYLLEERPSFAETSALWQSPEQPLQSVKDAVAELVNVLTQIGSRDQVSLSVFATSAHNEAPLTLSYSTILDTLNERQAGHYDSYTCIGCGIGYGRSSLIGAPGARPYVDRVLVLLTDGLANVDAAGTYYQDPQTAGPALDYARDEAQTTADAGVTIHTIVVGAEASNPAVQSLMQDIAAIGRGQSFEATGTVEDYREQLAEIFRTIGATYRAVLIQ